MKKKYLIYLLTLLMVLSPAAAFADAEAEGAQEEAVSAEEMHGEGAAPEAPAAPAAAEEATAASSAAEEDTTASSATMILLSSKTL